MDHSSLETCKARARAWFEALRDDICAALEALEEALPADAPFAGGSVGRFVRTPWQRIDHDGRPGGGGMMAFSLPNHAAGILGLPRRVYDVTFLGAEQAKSWVPLTKISAVGAVVLFVSALSYLVVVLATWLGGRRFETAPAFEFATPLAPVGRKGIWDRIGLWTAVAAVMVLVAYAYPILHLLMQHRYGSPGFQPF